MRAPPVRVNCECGDFRVLAYGERWECETCGRRWNTEQIPADEYRSFARAVRRYQLVSVAFIVVLLAIFVPLIVLVDPRIGFSGLILAFVWSTFVRPRQRRKLLETARGPRWELSPE